MIEFDKLHREWLNILQKRIIMPDHLIRSGCVRYIILAVYIRGRKPDFEVRIVKCRGLGRHEFTVSPEYA